MPSGSDSLFGTDGIRGRIGRFPLTDEGLRLLGAAMGERIGGMPILTAMDTRYSGPDILARIAEGLAGRCRIDSLGVLPTPGLSYLVAGGEWQIGMMITASHNPAEDNGIKLFNGQGEKVDDDVEAEISRSFFALLDQSPIKGGMKDTLESGCPKQAKATPYLAFMAEQARRTPMKGMTLVVDTANGAMSAVAPEVLRETGARLRLFADRPDGRNINQNCGSQHPQSLLNAVLEQKADWGIAFDGDGDRVLLVDGPGGRILDGDDILYLLARYRLTKDPAFSRTVVGTIMSNLGLESALASLGVELVRADVGDRHVYREMKRLQADLGGEPSGHVIIRSHQRSGDGLLTALHFLRAMGELGLTADDLFRQMRRFPQKLLSVPVRHKPDLKSWPELAALEQEFRRDSAAHQARMLIRYSGTEDKIRLMVESDDERVVENWIERLDHFIMKTIGEKNETLG